MWSCGRRAPMEEALVRVRAGAADPHCLECRGLLKSDPLPFGQLLVPPGVERLGAAPAVAGLPVPLAQTVPDVPPAGFGFGAQMPAGLARMIYWPDETEGFHWAVEAKTKKGWSRFTEHHYRKA